MPWNDTPADVGLTEEDVARERKVWEDTVYNPIKEVDLFDETWYGVAVGFFLGRGFNITQARFMTGQVEY